MEEEAEAEAQREERQAPLLSLSRLRDVFQSRSWTRYVAAAAAFAVLLGVYTFSQSGGGNSLLPGGNDPAQVADAEIGDNEIPLVEPEFPVPEDPVDAPDPEVEPQPQTEPAPVVDPQPAVTPAPPVQSAENTPRPADPQPAVPPAPEQPSEEIIEDEETPAAEGPEYAGGLEEQPAEGEGPQEEPSEDPQEPPEEEKPQEDILGSLLALALQNESFAESFAAEDLGFGYQVLKAEDVPDGTQFMVYFYESEEEAADQTVNEENIRSILWKRESL